MRIEARRRKGGDDVVGLIIGLSATVSLDRAAAVLGPNANLWVIQAANPHNDIMRRSADLRSFRQLMRRTMDEIKASCPTAQQIHVFPAMPVSCAIELGRVWMPKADLPLLVYDENRKLGGFQPAVRIEG